MVNRILVNELFDTVQGEATFTGTPSTFVRLHECPVGCPWCDTKYTWKTKPDKAVSLEEVKAKTRNSIKYADSDVDQLLQELVSRTPPHIVLTGGEPCIYELTALTQALADAGKTVQIETSGTHEVRCCPSTWVTVSPKYDMPGGFEVLESALSRANELKLPVEGSGDIARARELKAKYPVPVWLQPVSQDESATELCVQQALLEGFRVSVQVHKYLGVR